MSDDMINTKAHEPKDAGEDTSSTGFCFFKNYTKKYIVIDIKVLIVLAMMDLGSEQQTTQPSTHVNMSTTRKELLSNVMKRTSDWILSQDIPSDITVHVGRSSFALHKDISGKGRKEIEPRTEYEKRVVVETIVSLLPREKNALSVSFLSLLLRAAIYLETTVSCRVDLERRMSLQLGQAVLDDLLIPSYSLTGGTLFDVGTVKRIMKNFLEYEMVGNRLDFNDEENVSSSASEMEKVGKVMQDYLAEIASDSNLFVSEFISVAEVIPEQCRITEDMMYKAIDMYLKAHPALSDIERKKVCSVMNCQKLTREACAHAAQNERLPVQIVVQVLYYEQQRLREVMDISLVQADPPSLPSKFNWLSTDISPVTDEISSLKRENQDLKFELMRLKMKCKEIEKRDGKSSASTPLGIITTPSDKPRLTGTSFITAVSRKLGKLYPSFGADQVAMPWPSIGKNKPSRNRRNSIS